MSSNRSPTKRSSTSANPTRSTSLASSRTTASTSTSNTTAAGVHTTPKRRDTTLATSTSTLRTPKWRHTLATRRSSSSLASVSSTTGNNPSLPHNRKNSSNGDKAPTTSISRIFAQPQLGSPLRSAVDGLPVGVVNELKPQTQASGGSGSVTPVDSMNTISGHVDSLKAFGDGGGQNAGDIVAATTKQPNGNAVASPMRNVSSTDTHVGTSDPNGTGIPLLPQVSRIPPRDMNPITSSSPQPLFLPLSESPKPISDQSLPPVSSEVSAVQVLEPGAIQPPEVEVKAPASTITTTTTVAVLPAAGPSDMKVKTSVDVLKVEEALDTTRRSGSWFGSWGRRKGKGTVMQGAMGMEIEGGDGASTGGPAGTKVGQEWNIGGSVMHDDKGERSGAQEVIDLTAPLGEADVFDATNALTTLSAPVTTLPLMVETSPDLPPTQVIAIPFPTTTPEPAPESPQPVVESEASPPPTKSSWFRSRAPKEQPQPPSGPNSNVSSQSRTSASTPTSSRPPIQDDASAIQTNLIAPLPSASVSTSTLVAPTPVNTSVEKGKHIPSGINTQIAATSISTTNPVPIPITPSDVTSTPTSISSLDSVVPPPVIGKDQALPVMNVETRERTASISSLNPSASRFVLRIPLLGRPKVPLEQVVGASGNGISNSKRGESDKGGVKADTALRSDDGTCQPSGGDKKGEQSILEGQGGNPPGVPEVQANPSLNSLPPSESNVKAESEVIECRNSVSTRSTGSTTPQPTEPSQSTDTTQDNGTTTSSSIVAGPAGYGSTWWGYLVFGGAAPEIAKEGERLDDGMKKESGGIAGLGGAGAAMASGSGPEKVLRPESTQPSTSSQAQARSRLNGAGITVRSGMGNSTTGKPALSLNASSSSSQAPTQEQQPIQGRPAAGSELESKGVKGLKDAIPSTADVDSDGGSQEANRQGDPEAIGQKSDAGRLKENSGVGSGMKDQGGVDGVGKPPSVLSADTAKSQGSVAAWYSPWAWYGSGATPGSSSDNPKGTADGKGEGEDAHVGGGGGGSGNGDEKKMTESEIVKEEALARDGGLGSGLEPGVVESSQDQAWKEQKGKEGKLEGKDAPPSVKEALDAAMSSSSNPIEKSMVDNTMGWAQFFMSRALMMKTITDGSEKDKEETVKRDENGMEVMELDDDELEAAGGGSAALVATSERPRAGSSGSGTTGKEMVLRTAQGLVPSNGTTPKAPSPTPSSKKLEREPKKSDPPAPPLTNSDSIKREVTKPKGTTGTTTTGPGGRAPSPAPSKKSGYASPTPSQNQQKVQTPNLVLPTWADTFHAPPRSIVPPPPPTKAGPSSVRDKISGAVKFVGGMLFAQPKDSVEDHPHSHSHAQTQTLQSPHLHQQQQRQQRPSHQGGKGKQRERSLGPEDELLFGKDLPKALDVLGQNMDETLLSGECRVVVIGVAGWSPGAVTRTIAGGFPSPSSKFVSMTCQALEKFEEEHGLKFKKITPIALEGDGTIERKVSRVHAHLLGNQEWMEDLHSADVIFMATHSQGSIISTHLLAKLIQEGHILTPRNIDILTSAAAAIVPGGVAGTTIPTPASSSRTQKICCLALCGIHLGPLRYLKTSSLLGQYIQYFENAAARELFEFQDTDSKLSKDYVKALQTVMDHGAKMVYVASLNDQVVPIYSGLFTAVSHPRILRALYIDGDAYHSSDFLANLLVLLIRILNSGLSDSGLLGHLSEATAGTLSGVGHSSAYEEIETFSLAVKYAFQVNEGADVRTDLVVEPFNAVNEQNDYEIPWSLRDLIADDRVSHLFADEFALLRDGFDDWAPKTSILRDVKRKLQPIQKLSSIKGGTGAGSYSRL